MWPMCHFDKLSASLCVSKRITNYELRIFETYVFYVPMCLKLNHEFLKTMWPMCHFDKLSAPLCVSKRITNHEFLKTMWPMCLCVSNRITSFIFSLPFSPIYPQNHSQESPNKSQRIMLINLD